LKIFVNGSQESSEKNSWVPIAMLWLVCKVFENYEKKEKEYKNKSKVSDSIKINFILTLNLPQISTKYVQTNKKMKEAVTG
jgi:hypothetical protein